VGFYSLSDRDDGKAGNEALDVYHEVKNLHLQEAFILNIWQKQSNIVGDDNIAHNVPFIKESLPN
jgi:hypothetical protein